MNRFAQKSPFLFWITVGLLIRLASSSTHSSWHHPDEWFQTVEFGNMIANGFMSHTQEVGLHMRNLSWPYLISLIIQGSDALFPGQMGMRVFFIQLIAGLFNLGMLWGAWQLLKKTSPSSVLQHLLGAAFILPWFTANDAIRPSQENMASAMLWISLGFLSNGRWKFAGLAAVGIGAMKYPAGLLSVGIYAAVLFEAFSSKNTLKASRFTVGVLAGLILFGLADWVYYGRPWESLWMYTQYNVFTGLSHQNFGSQSVLVYWDHFFGHWIRFLFPFGVALLSFGIPGVYWGVRNREPWAWAFLVYLVGHSLIAHKEPRFFAPVEFVFVWAALYGWMTFRKKWPNHLLFSSLQPWMKKGVTGVLILFFVINGLKGLRAVWGENWIALETYFELPSHLKAHPNTCAVITSRKPLSAHLPTRSGRLDVPSPALGYFAGRRRSPSFDEAAHRPLIWIQRSPLCDIEETLLLHVHKPHPKWEEEGCRLLRSGVLRVFPQSTWDTILEKNLLSGPWYACPSQVSGVFQRQETRKILSHGFGKIPQLPPIGVSGKELMRIQKITQQRDSLGDGTLGDW